MYGDMRTNVFGKLFGPILIRKVKLFPSLYNIFIHIKPSLLETMVIIMQVDFVNCKFIHSAEVRVETVMIFMSQTYRALTWPWSKILDSIANPKRLNL